MIIRTGETAAIVRGCNVIDIEDPKNQESAAKLLFSSCHSKYRFCGMRQKIYTA